MKVKEYDVLSRVLHFTMAVIIFYTFIGGYIGPHLSHHMEKIMATINVSLAMIATPLFIIRFVWSFFRTSPPLPQSIPKFQKNFARLSQSLIYQLMFTVFLSGFLMLSHPVTFFWLISVPNVITDSGVNDFFFDVHRVSCILLILMLVLHITAVIKHTFVNKDNIIRLMFPKKM